MQGVLRSSVLAFALLPAFGAAASADAGCGGAGKPPCTILRPAADPPPRETGVGWGQDCIVIVGGLGSPVDGSDAGFFSAVLGDLVHSIDHRLIRFGVDRGSFDTNGAISRSGAALGGVIRDIADDCDAIHLVAHSMGGVVVDRALSKLDPAASGVSTYVAMASPHNGATVARVAHAVSAVSEAIGTGDLTSDAIDDLAATRAPRRIPRVEHVRLRIRTDLLVLRHDNYDRRVDVREFGPASLSEVEGHSRIVQDQRVQDIVRETIARGRVPRELQGSW